MTTIPMEAVEAAARALCRNGTSFPTPEQTLAWVDEKWPRFKDEAELAISAALPHLAKPVDGERQPIGYIDQGTLENLKEFGGLYRIASPKWHRDGGKENIPLYTTALGAGTVAQEPVAWRWRYEDEDTWTLRTSKPPTFLGAIAEPLYATPRPAAVAVPEVNRVFKLGDRVQKRSGSSWNGRVVGFYSTELTPIGYAVESEREPGSVQIYPEVALTAAPSPASEPAPSIVDQLERVTDALEDRFTEIAALKAENERLRKAVRAAEQEFNIISCEGVTETRSISDAFDRAKSFADRGATSARAALSSQEVSE